METENETTLTDDEKPPEVQHTDPPSKGTIFPAGPVRTSKCEHGVFYVPPGCPKGC
jgi:hypothetical protein